MARLSSGDRHSVSRDYSYKPDESSLNVDALYNAILAALDKEETRKTLLALDDDQIGNLISFFSEEKKKVVRQRVADLREQDKPGLLRSLGLR